MTTANNPHYAGCLLLWYTPSMFSFGVFGKNDGARTVKEYEPLIKKVAVFEPELSLLSDEALRQKTLYFKEKIAEGATLDAILPEAFAVVREASKRVLGERHYDVQIIGGITLHKGNIAEMRTGEGKTLVATLPAYLNALSGKGVHVVTVNEYLARRDAVWMGQVYASLGLSVSVINAFASYMYDLTHSDAGEDKERDQLGSFKVVHEFLRPCTRREAYEADITYGTNSEFGFDYLRDNIEYDVRELRQRDPHFAIVDEIDSILIDEARTPLIISAPAAESEDLYAKFATIARQLEKDADFEVDEKQRAVTLTEKGIEKAEKFLGVENIYTDKGIKYVHHLETAVRAKALFELDKHYVVRDGEVVIVDEFTGRMQPGRRWSEGLHQAIEAKEGVPVQRESRTFASITYQNYFRMYEKLAGMTGTASTSKEEFYSVYGLDVIAIPTNKQIARIDHNDLIFINERGKYQAIAKKVKELHKKGQPVLIGTVSIEKNEALSQYLTKEGVPHELLNAKNHEREGEIIAQAGHKGRVTLATNMAGRGVDIKLGGNPATKEAYEDVKEKGGLFVLGTERHEARRIDDQLRGRAGRQGDPGATQFYVSLEDSLMRVFGNSETIKRVMTKATQSEDEPIQHSLITKTLENAQKRIEGFHFDARKRVLAFDDVLNQQRLSMYAQRRALLVGAKEDVAHYLTSVVAGDADTEAVIAEKKALLGEEEFYHIARRLCLQVIDLFWLEHLEMMDHLRSSVNLRAYGQRDPLIEYRKDGLRLFRDLEGAISDQIIKLLPSVGAGAFVKEEEQMKKEAAQAQQQSAQASAGSSGTMKTPVTRNAEEKIGRNEMVTITDGVQTQTLKYKKAESFLQNGWKIVK